MRRNSALALLSALLVLALCACGDSDAKQDETPTVKIGVFEPLSGQNGPGGKQEYLLPTIVDGLLKCSRANVKVLESKDKWVGVTYKEDKPVVVESIKELISSGKYPDRLYEMI